MSNGNLDGTGLIGGESTGFWTALLTNESDPGRSVVLAEGHRVAGRPMGAAEALRREPDPPVTRLTLVKAKPFPFPPEPLAYLGIQAIRWSLAQADRRCGGRYRGSAP